MTISTFNHRSRRRAGGFTIVAAVFLLVVLAGLGVALVNISTLQHAESALDVQGARAYQAARAGVEWGLFRQLRPTPAAACFADTTFALPAGSTLSSFSVTVRCQRSVAPGTEAQGLVRWQIVATACNLPSGAALGCPNFSPNPDYVQRVVQVEF